MPHTDPFTQVSKIPRRQIPRYCKHTKESLYIIYWLIYTNWPVESPLPVYCELSAYMHISESMVCRGVLRLIKLKHLIKVKPFRCWRTYLNPDLNWDKLRSLIPAHNGKLIHMEQAQLAEFFRANMKDYPPLPES